MDQGQLAQYRNAILGELPGTSTSSPAVTPELAASFGNLQNLAKSGLQGTVASKTMNAFGGAAQAVSAQEEADAKLRLQEAQDQAAAAEQAKKDMLDPTKYRQELAEDGGYRFYDPQGNEIDVKQYSGATGKHITEVLKKSQNQADKDFVNNYKTVETFGEIFANDDKKKLDKLFKDDPTAKEDYDALGKQLGRKPTYNDIVASFRSGYPQYFNANKPVASPKTTYGSKTVNEIGGGNKNLFQRLMGALGG